MKEWANSGDLDQTAPKRSSLIRVSTVFLCISVRIFRITTLNAIKLNFKEITCKCCKNGKHARLKENTRSPD